MMRVLVADRLQSPWADLPDDVSVSYCGWSSADIDAAITPEVEILVADTLPDAVDRCHGLRWVQLMSAGYSQAIGHPLTQRNIRFSTAAGMSAVHCAEFMVTCLLHHVRRFRHFESLQQSRTWSDRFALASPIMRELHVVLVGYGAIGREAARLLSAFGVRLTVVNSTGRIGPQDGYMPYPGTGDPQGTIPQRVVASDRLVDVVADADAIALAVPLSPGTRHLVNDAVLQQTKPSAILINIARGSVIDTPAVVRALDEGRLAHAYLDVFEQEPLPPDSPLWQHPKISVSPHMAGVLPDHEPLLHDLFIQNLARYRDGSELLNEIAPGKLVTA